MGTRSDIIVHRADGTWKRIYCHWDGYLSHNGRILHEHYTTQEKCEALVAPGDLSSLGEEIGVKHPFDGPSLFVGRAAKKNPKYEAYKKKYGNMCKYYGRDRGETDVDSTVGDSLQAVWPEEDTWTEFTYVWDDGKWWVASADEGSQALKPLKDALEGKVDVNANVKVPFIGVIGKHKKAG